MVESGALEKHYTGNGIKGSNPFSSANAKTHLLGAFLSEWRRASHLRGLRKGFESRSVVLSVAPAPRGRVGALSERRSRC